MTAWTPPARAWRARSRLGAMVVLVVVAWLGAGWPWVTPWPAVVALLALAIGACRALAMALASARRRERWRTAVEAALCVLFVGACALAYFAIDAASSGAGC